MRKVLLLAAAAFSVAACSSPTGSNSGATTPTTVTTTQPVAATTTAASTTTVSTPVASDTTGVSTTVVSTTVAVTVKPDPARPYTVFVPTSYHQGAPMPLVILLHGFGATGAIQDAYFGMQALAQSKGFLYVHPDGTLNQLGKQFWNATDGCCGYHSTVDDVAYLTGIIDQVSTKYDVDPKRIYFIGHSNGGFMSYRMACELSGRVAAIASMAGATFDDPTKCNPSEPVSVLQVHGTADRTIAYTGGVTPVINGTYPGAEQSVATWAKYDGCTGTRDAVGGEMNLEPNIAGAETQRSAFTGCPKGIDVQLLTVQGGPHVPTVAFPDQSRPMINAMVDFLLAHPKP
jgi:polyhydroxybutyrate depolymerase